MSGALQVSAGVLLLYLGFSQDSAIHSLLFYALTAVIFGSGMYLVVYRRYAREATRAPAAPPTTRRESPLQTGARVAIATLCIVGAFVVIAVIIDAAVAIAGICTGNGVAIAAMGRSLRLWERREHCALLREPRWRWKRTAEGRWGHGQLDPRDVYCVGPASVHVQ